MVVDVDGCDESAYCCCDDCLVENVETVDDESSDEIMLLVLPFGDGRLITIHNHMRQIVFNYYIFLFQCFFYIQRIIFLKSQNIFIQFVNLKFPKFYFYNLDNNSNTC